jgi:hypothetical protein
MGSVKCPICGRYIAHKNTEHRCSVEVDLYDQHGQLLANATGRNLTSAVKRVTHLAELSTRKQVATIKALKAKITVTL